MIKCVAGFLVVLVASIVAAGCALCGYQYGASAKVPVGTAGQVPTSPPIADVVASALAPFGVSAPSWSQGGPEIHYVVGNPRGWAPSVISVYVDPTNGTVSIVDTEHGAPSKLVLAVQNAVRERLRQEYGVSVEFTQRTARISRCQLGP